MQDWDAMIPVGKITHYLGDAICLVAAETPEILEKAKKLVEVEYEPLKPVFSPTYAAQPFAPLVHESGNLLCEKHVSRGNADQAIREADYVLMYHYETPYTEHAFLEPECAVAYPDGDGVFYPLHGPGHLRHRAGNVHYAGSSQGKGPCDQYAGGRRLRRQGGHDRAAPCCPDRLSIRPAGKGEAHPAGEHPRPPQAPPHEGDHYHGLQ